MAHASDMKPGRIGIKIQQGEGNDKLGSITIPLTSVDGRAAGDQVELRVIGTIEKLGKESAVLKLADIQPTEPVNVASAMEQSMRKGV